MKVHSTLYGLVLAGGRSSRMGEDKSRLLWQGKPLYQHMIHLLHKAGIEQVLLSGAGFPEKTVEDLVPGRGPLSGIHAALMSLEYGERLLVIPVDMPLVPLEAIQTLYEQSDKQQLCCFDGFNLPVVIPVTEDSRRVIVEKIQSDNPKDYALWRLYQALGGKTIPLPEDRIQLFSNANTPEEWRRINH
ncbi:molybdenum cofactor guanylyltransferase [Endozoicomonas ascidiicola]|uniref:molybdenum cofactor guanylyltransferase n=1 Tax=Endozoicomonas ascidiicola TaxID=1698521 RepID=UPI00083203B5|nr:molybdenum cofactor guanylyltransferase [Endozoicomonas ascidiicola]